jgi:hypothetical protein
MNNVRCMWTHRYSMAAIALCLQCGGSTTSPDQVEESPGDESDMSDMTEETPTPSPDEEAAGSDEPSTPSEPSSDKEEGQSGGSKKGCTELAKDQCQITAGCAWSTLGKCVEEGASEPTVP